MSDMPADPFGPPDEMRGMMKGMYQLHTAAMMEGFPEHIATQFITGVFMSLMSSAQNAAPQEE